MKLSELVSIAPENVEKNVYGVEVDEYCVTRQFGVSEIGLIVKTSDEGIIDEDLVDVATDYVDAGCQVILEVPAECRVVTSYLYMLANNIGATISLLPPLTATPESIEHYGDRLCEFAREWLSDGQCHQMLEPVSGYFQYLINTAYGYQPDKIAIDEYMNSEFVENMEVSDMDHVKNKLQLVIYDEFGGEKMFIEWAHSLGDAIHKELTRLSN